MKKYILLFCVIISTFINAGIAQDSRIIKKLDFQNLSEFEFSKDGKFLVGGGVGITIWETQNWNIYRRINIDKELLGALRISPDGKTIACGYSRDIDEIVLIDIASGYITRTLEHDLDVLEDLEYSPDMHYLAACDDEGDIQVWDLKTGKELISLDANNRWPRIAFNPNKKMFVSHFSRREREKSTVAGNYKNISCLRIWDTSDWKLIKEFNDFFFGKIGSFSEDGQLYLGLINPYPSKEDIQDEERVYAEIRILETKNWNFKSNFPLPWKSEIKFLEFGPEKNLITIHVENKIEVLDIENKTRVFELLLPGDKIDNVQFSPDWKLLACTRWNKNIQKREMYILDFYIEKRGLPPILYAELDFKDPNDNGILESQEAGELLIRLTNKGKGKAQRLKIFTEDNIHDPALIIHENEILELNPEESVDIELKIQAHFDVETAQHKIKINVLEHFGYDMDPAYLILNTKAYEPPELVFSGAEIKDTGEGTAAIIPDGQIQAGELVKARIIVQNIGLGVAEHVKFFLKSEDPNIFIEGNKGYLGEINPGATKEFWLTISPNKRVKSENSLPLYLSLFNRYSKGSLINFNLPIKLNNKPPGVNIVSIQPQIAPATSKAKFEINSNRFTTRVRDIINIQLVEPSKTRLPKSVGLVLGVEKYKDLPSAPYAANDADIMKKFFEKRLGVEKVVVLKNEDVSGFIFDDIINPSYGELQRSIIKGETELFIYYSGHGIPNANGDKIYLFPYDGKVERLESQGYSLLKFYENLSKLDAKHVTVIIDACFSGASRETEKISTQNLIATKGVRLSISKPWLNYPNFTVINSSSGTETSLGFEKTQSGLFTYYFAAGLQGEADTNKDRKITLGELKEYVIKNVSETSKKIKRIQTPEFYGNETEILVNY